MNVLVFFFRPFFSKLQGGSGYVKNIKYEHIKMDSVDHPILIDQYYCNGKHDCPTHVR